MNQPDRESVQLTNGAEVLREMKQMTAGRSKLKLHAIKQNINI
jgi:hypothetical protein